MKYRLLGKSGAVVSALALGAMTFGGESDEVTSREILDRYAEAGGTFVDTADIYNRGASEEVIGRWLKDRPTERERVVLTSKGRYAMGDTPNDVGTSRRHLRRALDDSLGRLGVDQIDMYQLHGWDPHTPLEESLRFVDEAIRSGKISYWGISNFTGWQLTKAVYLAKVLGLHEPITIQAQYSLLSRGVELEVVPAAEDARLGLLPWSPLAAGWLTGKYKQNVTPTGLTRLGENPERGLAGWEAQNADTRTWRVLKAVSQIAEEHEASHGEVALAWALGRPAVSSVILGVRTVAQLDRNLSAVALALSDEEMMLLDRSSSPTPEGYPYDARAIVQRSRKLEGGR